MSPRNATSTGESAGPPRAAAAQIRGMRPFISGPVGQTYPAVIAEGNVMKVANNEYRRIEPLNSLANFPKPGHWRWSASLAGS